MRPLTLAASEALDQSAALPSSDVRASEGFECDVCGQHFSTLPAGSGLFIWTRGEEVRYEEPPLCEVCAAKVTAGALITFDPGDEEEG